MNGVLGNLEGYFACHWSKQELNLYRCKLV